MAAKKAQSEVKSVLARQGDGTLQITFTIPFSTVQKVREGVIRELATQVEVPGFRKGKVPVDLAMKNIDRQRLYEHTLQHLLPEHYAKAVVEHKLRPVLQPRFELVAVEEDRDWQIRAVTCELPNVDLGDYKSKVKGAPSTHAVRSGPSREQKEQQIIQRLLETTDLGLPALLVEEEVNHKLSQLLDQVQKLGLTVEQYLASSGKTIEQVKADYAKQSQDSIKLVLILNKVAQKEGIQVTEKEIDEVVKASGGAEGNGKAEHQIHHEEQKALIRAVLSRRKALDSLVSLA